MFRARGIFVASVEILGLNIFWCWNIFCENQIFLKKIHITSAVGDALSWSHSGQLRSYLLSPPVTVQHSDCTDHCTGHCTLQILLQSLSFCNTTARFPILDWLKGSSIIGYFLSFHLNKVEVQCKLETTEGIVGWEAEYTYLDTLIPAWNQDWCTSMYMAWVLRRQCLYKIKILQCRPCQSNIHLR